MHSPSGGVPTPLLRSPQPVRTCAPWSGPTEYTVIRRERSFCMCGNYGSTPGHRTTEALHVAPMVVARAFTPPETAWQVGRPVAQAVVPCSNSPGNGRYRCFRGARNSPRESQFWPFNRLPWLGHARLDFGKLNGQRAVPCPRGGVCALRAPRNAASRFWPFFGAAGRF